MHRFTNKNGIELIKKLEGFKSEPYFCSGGHLTIGYGHKLLPNDYFQKIDEKQASKILEQDLLYTERQVIRYINVLLSDNQFAALVSFTFNVGAAALQRSTLRQKINYGLYKEASKEFYKWIFAGGKKNLGLFRRRKLEVNLFLST